MFFQPKKPATKVLIWVFLMIAALGPVAAIGTSPLLAYREPIYILASFAGGVAMALLVLQPLLALGWLPGLSVRIGRRVHRVTGLVLLTLVIVHVIALWITSPPDVLDALAFRSPTQFSLWGVIAMWGVFVTAIIAAFRTSLGLWAWRGLHMGLAVIVVVGTVIHVLLIDGTMEPVSKVALCGLVGVVTLITVGDVWSRRK